MTHPDTPADSTDGRRRRGDASRAVITAAAAQLASEVGLDGISIARVAAEVSMSKAGVVALFGSKEQLQLATLESASRTYQRVVIDPALSAEGMGRLHALVDRWLEYSRTRVFRGGCFFAAVSAEVSATPGALRDAVTASMDHWHRYLATVVNTAVARGELPADTEADLLVFQITALLDGANVASLLRDSDEPYALARRAIEALLPPAPPAVRESTPPTRRPKESGRELEGR